MHSNSTNRNRYTGKGYKLPHFSGNSMESDPSTSFPGSFGAKGSPNSNVPVETLIDNAYSFREQKGTSPAFESNSRDQLRKFLGGIRIIAAERKSTLPPAQYMHCTKNLRKLKTVINSRRITWWWCRTVLFLSSNIFLLGVHLKLWKQHCCADTLQGFRQYFFLVFQDISELPSYNYIQSKKLKGAQSRHFELFWASTKLLLNWWKPENNTLQR